MQNVELKARYPDLQRARQICLELGAKLLRSEEQVDTYLQVRAGRLKIRESQSETSLIYYDRPDQSGPTVSSFEVAPMPTEPSKLKAVLVRVLGTRGVVKKCREVFALGPVRIHVDEVSGLGSFLEFEYTVGRAGDDELTARKRLDELQESFGISKNQLVETSYLDLVMRTSRESRVATPKSGSGL